MQSNHPEHENGKGKSLVIIVPIFVVAVIIGVVALRSKPTATVPGANPAVAANGSSSEQNSLPASSESATNAGAQVSATPDASAQASSKADDEVAALVRILTDHSKSVAERKAALQALARNGSPEALAILKSALASGNNDLRAAIAEAMGGCGTPDCLAVLTGLLDDPNKEVAKAAIRGLAQQGSPQAIETLNNLLNNGTKSADLRSAAAEGLGQINQPGAFEALSRAALTLNDEDLVTDVLAALGTRNLSETGEFFRNYLRSGNVSSELRVAAVEALAHTQGDPTALLMEAAADRDSDVRASAGWALSATEESGNSGSQLLALIRGESDPDVRLRLYQALGNQTDVDVTAALAAVRQEQDAAARVSGLSLLAKLVRDNPTVELQSFFDQQAIPELKQAALNGATKDERMAAAIALIRSNTPGANAVLKELAQVANDPSVKDSAQKATRNSPFAQR